MPLDRQMFSDKLRRYMAQLQVDADAIASATGILRTRVENLITEQADPTGDEVLILADYFKCDFKFFISNEKLASFEHTELLYRRHGKDLQREDRWAIQEFLFLCESQEYLLSQMPGRRRRPFSFQKRGDFYKGHGRDAADALRNYLSYLPNQLPGNVFETFREIGIHVFRRHLGTSAISGLFIRHPAAGRCVLVNYSEDPFRQRFTVAHEAGHAVLDDDESFVVSFTRWDGGDLREVRANTFASHFLLPPEVLRILPNPSGWTEADFVDQAARLMVNSETLAYAMRDAGLLIEARADVLKRCKVPSVRKIDPELPPSLSPRSLERKRQLLERGLSDSYVSLCFDAYDAGLISAQRLAEILLVSASEVGEMASLYGRALSHGD